ncbi:MAG: type IV secretion protein IcmD [Gammaproteobacteria bacterium]|nr:type IV secretion protein IcmD [Gammaproteobacteria bacterium]
MTKAHFNSKCFPYLKGMFKLSMIIGLFYSGIALGQSADSGIGGIAANITSQFSKIGQLILAIAFLGGIGFIMAAIFKFKQHKDNPTQIPLGTPIAMLVIGAFLVFMPSLIAPAGATIFKGSATAGGFTGAGASAIPGAS